MNPRAGAGAVSGAGSVLLNGTTSPGNQIVNLGTSNAKTDFALIDFRDLTVKGPVVPNIDLNNGSVTITAHAGAGTNGNLTNSSTILAHGNAASGAPDGNISNDGTADSPPANGLVLAVNKRCNIVGRHQEAGASRQAGASRTTAPKANRGDADLTATVDINNNGAVIASNNASLGAGHDINNIGGTNNGGIVQASTINASLIAGHDVNTSGTVEAGHDAILTSGTAATVVPGDTLSGIFQTGGIITAGGTNETTAAVALTAENVANITGAG